MRHSTEASRGGEKKPEQSENAQEMLPANRLGDEHKLLPRPGSSDFVIDSLPAPRELVICTRVTRAPQQNVKIRWKIPKQCRERLSGAAHHDVPSCSTAGRKRKGKSPSMLHGYRAATPSCSSRNQHPSSPAKGQLHGPT